MLEPGTSSAEPHVPPLLLLVVLRAANTLRVGHPARLAISRRPPVADLCAANRAIRFPDPDRLSRQEPGETRIRSTSKSDRMVSTGYSTIEFLVIGQDPIPSIPG